MLHETFGNFAFAIACRVLALRDIGWALSPFNAFLHPHRHRDAAAARSSTARACSQSPNGSLRSHRPPGYPGLPGDRYYNLAKKYCPEGAGAVFTFGLKGGYEAGVKLVSNVKLFSHLANIGDTLLADHSSRFDHAPAAQRRARRSRPAAARTRRLLSASRKTSSPTRQALAKSHARAAAVMTRGTGCDGGRMRRGRRQDQHRHCLVDERDREWNTPEQRPHPEPRLNGDGREQHDGASERRPLLRCACDIKDVQESADKNPVGEHAVVELDCERIFEKIPP